MRDGSKRSPALTVQGLEDSLVRAAFDSNPLPMWIYDEETLRVLAVNDCALDCFGHRREQFPAMPMTVLETMPESGLEREGADGTLRHHRKPDGTLLAMRLQTSGLEIDGCRARLVIALDAGRESRGLAEIDRYRGLLAAAAEWVWESDAALRISRLSPEFEPATGLVPESFLGRRLEEPAATTGDGDQSVAHRAKIDARAPFRDLVFKVAGPGGAAIWLEIGGTPAFDPDGAFLGYRGVGSNVTAAFEANLTLRRREERYARFFDTAPVWFWEMDQSYRLTFVSPNSERALGLALDDYRGRRLSEIPGVTIDPEIAKPILAAQKARQPYQDFVYTLLRPNGTTAWISTSASPVFDEDGCFSGYCGIARDVTAQIEAERTLRDSERQYRELFETAADWYWESGIEGHVTFLSPNYEAICGVSPEQMLGKRVYETPGVSFEQEMGRMVLEARVAKQPFRDFVYSRTFPDGRKHWFKISAAPILGPDGTYRGYRGVGAEITKSVEVEATARLALRRLDGAIAYVTQPFVVFDHEDRAIAFNPAFGSLHRTPTSYAPFVLGDPLRELVTWQLQVGFYAEGPGEETLDFDTLLALHRNEGEHTYHLNDGRWMLVTYRRLPGDARVGLWSDITAIKGAEQSRLRLEEQLHHSQRLEALGTLAGGVAHEINNALVPVLALTQMTFRKLPQESRERRNLETVLQGTARIRDLVKRILAFSRKEEHHRESVDVAAVLDEALLMMRATLPANIRLDPAIDRVPPVRGDPNQIHQVIINLVTNAAQAIGQAMGTITVTLRDDPQGARVHLSVSDTGCGMDETTKARIFEPFFTTKEVGEGTGLGLSVAHGIVGEHGGAICVASAPGEGTRFEVFLPVEPAAAQSDPREAPGRLAAGGDT